MAITCTVALYKGVFEQGEGAAVSTGASAPASTCRYVLWLDTVTEQPAEVSTRAPQI